MFLRYDQTLLPESFSLSCTPRLDAAALPFQVHACGHFHVPEIYFTEREGMDSHLLLLGLEGTGKLEYGGHTHLIPPFHAVVFDCMKPQAYRSAFGTWTFRWVHFRGTAVREYVRRIHGNAFTPVSLASVNKTNGLLDSLFTLIQQQEKHLDTEAALLMTSLLTELIRAGSDLVNPAAFPAHRLEVESAIRFMEAHWREKISAEDILSPAHLSPWHFSRLFREQTGMSPYEYLIHIRMSKAVTDLLQTDDTVEQIAIRNGFGDATQFIRRFRRHYCTTPAVFRKHVGWDGLP